jgi:hypothetical protein
MSLDLSILGHDGNPGRSVPLNVDEHWALVQEADRLGLSLWKRMSDYYEDADYSQQEVLPLLEETIRLKSGFLDSEHLSKLIEVEELLTVALAGQSRVSAIAD